MGAVVLICHSSPSVFYEEGGAARRSMSDQTSRLNWVTVGALDSFSRRGAGGTFPVHLAGVLDRTGAALDLGRLGHRHGLPPPSHPSRIPDAAVARIHPDHLRRARIAGRPALLGRDPPPPSSERRQERRSPFAPRRLVVVACWLAGARRPDARCRTRALRTRPSARRLSLLAGEMARLPLLVLSAVLAVWGAVREGAFLAASLVSWGIFLRTTVELHGTWLVNSAAHTWGSRRFQTRDDSTNNWWVALLTFGEGWHNNHHADPRCVRHGLAWYELDINWLCIRALQPYRACEEPLSRSDVRGHGPNTRSGPTGSFGNGFQRKQVSRWCRSGFVDGR